ncbi:uncharacterized protein LOC127289371 [Leptopilina boulardi]|uniref:uncharacterized protein LOC127289371 n=1 Tax=Leptopilina boulardi TaxID=63433 RepID=UPI0021F53BEB|nr:uncharacterized protein LOC127289371 [Leptopilina boulardi]
MSVDTLSSPLGTVYMISMYSYFNLLSDFLYSNNYLFNYDKYKPIMVVNAFYRYLEDNQNNQDDLIRSLLQGSDLYGEKVGEIPDGTFVNAMYEYIITSLVFAKYGNIYGFLADVVRKSQDLHINTLLKEIRSTLEKIRFQNEYGNHSSLTPLAADRIFTDIILPLFPQPKTNLKLTSLDYIYAQAGAILLRSGRQNIDYYFTTESNERIILNNETLFEEYLIIGLLIEQNIIVEKFDKLKVTAFALPALFVYVQNQKEKLNQEKITTIVFDPQHWRNAYNIFLTYLDTIYYKIYTVLKKDTKYKLHFELSNFKTFSTYARYFIDADFYCGRKPEEVKIDRVSAYENNPHNFACKMGEYLPDLEVYFANKIFNIVNTYQKFENESIAKAFENYFHSSIRDTEVIIKLRDNIVVTDFYDPSIQSNDFLEIYFPANGTTNYYVVIRENYNHRIDKVDHLPDSLPQSDRPPIKKQDEKVSFTQQLNEIKENIVKRKSLRLKTLLLSSRQGRLKIDWWKEFGLPLIAYYKCLSGTDFNSNKKDPCLLDMHIMHNFNNISINLVQEDTQSILTLLGTIIKTLSLKNLLIFIIGMNVDTISENFDDYIKYEKLSKFANITLDINLQNLLRLSNPKFNIVLKNNNVLKILRKNVETFKNFTSLELVSLFSMMYNIGKYLNRYVMPLTKHSNYLDLNLTVMSQFECSDIFISRCDSGYGYKFVTLSDYNIASLRTIHQSDGENILLLLLYKIIAIDEKIFEIINSTSLHRTRQFLYEIDYKLQYDYNRLRFSATDVDEYNLIYCNYESEPQPQLNLCPRIKNKKKQEEIQTKILNMFRNDMLYPSKADLIKVIDNYVFPDENFFVDEFVRKWKSESNLLTPLYGKQYIIEHRNDFLTLRYKEWLDSKYLKFEDAENRINQLYTQQERKLIEKKTTLNEILIIYKSRNEYFSATFEDYYALRNFATTGYRRIKSDTNEAKQMKIALYNLAIRQSDDPDKNFDLVLSTVEFMHMDSSKKLFSHDYKYTLEKFTFTAVPTVTNANTILNKKEGFENILFEMSFSKPYLRAKINQMYYTAVEQTKSILLPGTEFSFVDSNYMNITGLGYVLRIRLKYIVNETNDKYEWYQKIMDAIADIKLSN